MGKIAPEEMRRNMTYPKGFNPSYYRTANPKVELVAEL